MAFQKAVNADDLLSGEMAGVTVAGTRLLIIKIDDKFFVYEDKCAHKGTPLSEGDLDGELLTCPTHLWEYDARTGTGVNPENSCLRSFPVRVDGNAVLVNLDFTEGGGPE